MPDCLHKGKKVFHRSKAYVALAKLASLDHFRFELVGFPEEKMLPDSDLSAGADQAFPVVRVLAQSPGQQDLDPTPQEVTGRRISPADWLGIKPSSSTVEARGKHPCVVEDEEVSGPQQAGKFAKLAVLVRSRGGGKVQQSRSSPIRQGLLGD